LIIIWILNWFVLNPNSIVNYSDITNRISENLEKDHNEFRKTRIHLSLIFKVCSHHLDDQAEEYDKNEENSEERNEIKEDLTYHLDQESKVINNSNVLHDLYDCLSHAHYWNDIVSDSFAHIIFLVLFEVKEQDDMDHVHKWHSEIIHIPTNQIFLELWQPLLLNFTQF
jgi:hypothetical protein